ncbi:Nitrogen regulatory protein P-II [Methanosarcina siciliae C2J]|uniref:Nitrogen regulatory protein P-II n=3 Tax=Methanosarcina siciliae TaxID=38027 RepID=A0A0E3PGJ4_9EURY|nr:P-II family nitrogen regulator [Methanosarcina siciliae]AKB29965.1 Nitrogen regulatory protein P-II [Methanosarcina siciliae T4/M]AKB33862.1 Nitrogen regulatory protein P-II [Methanosarcina siciliae HI350]AKB38224.1 Nitrogen regulatory protein P-II [Methanosarcina siciliae C2J]
MKEITAIIRMNKVQKTKNALLGCGFPSFTVRRVMGRGKQRGLCFEFNPPLPDPEKEAETCIRFIPKRMFTIVVDDENVSEVVQKIIEVNQTGNAGDGKIFVSNITEAIRIRTGESGEATISKELM